MIKFILLAIILAIFSLNGGVLGCIGFIFFVWMTDRYSLTGNKKDKEYDPDVHRKYINDQKL